MEYESITEQIIAAAYTVHNTLGSGYLEKVYENAMVIELDKRGLQVFSQYPIAVSYQGHIVGEYLVDLLVENCVIIELKAVENLHPRHETQLVNYLTSTGHNIGLLINFGLSVGIKRKYVNTQNPVNPVILSINFALCKNPLYPKAPAILDRSKCATGCSYLTPSGRPSSGSVSSPSKRPRWKTCRH